MSRHRYIVDPIGTDEWVSYAPSLGSLACGFIADTAVEALAGALLVNGELFNYLSGKEEEA